VEGVDAQAARAIAARAEPGRLTDDEARELLAAVGIDPPGDTRVTLIADPDLGPLIGVGDAYRLAPLTDVDVEELAPDDPALRELVVRLAALSDAVPALSEVVFDPPSVTLGPAPERQRAKTW
jgi:hypothetical protein